MVPPSCCDADGAPWWLKLTLLYSKHIPKVPGMLSKFHWIWPNGYGDTLHDRFLRDCFLQWPENALLWSHPAMAAPNPADPIAALTAALVKLLNQPLISLVTPSFNWNTTEQYDDFQLFRKSVESWFTLQNIPVETAPGAGPDMEPNLTRLEYVLNFLGNTGHRKFDHWKLTGTADEISKKNKQASAFMDYLSSMMNHAVSQCCRIYQLEDVHIWPGELPDELVNHLCALADWCNFPSDEEKEWNIQYRLVRALNDKELIKKLLTLDLMATAPKMLGVCWTHIAISDNLEAMGLKEQKIVNAIRKQNKPCQGKKPPPDSVHSCGHCTKSHPPGQSSCPAWDDICLGCRKKGHWKPKCLSGHKGPKYHNRGGRQKKVNEVGTDEDNWDIWCSDRLNNRSLCDCPDASWNWTQSTCDSQVQGRHQCRWWCHATAHICQAVPQTYQCWWVIKRTEVIHNMPDSLQWIQDTPVQNTGYSNRLDSQRDKKLQTIYRHNGT